MAGRSEDLLIRHIASPNESLEQPILGDIYIRAHNFSVFNPRGVGKHWQRTAIEVLPEDILLEIFDFYRLDAMEQSKGRPWKWHRLAHVCRKWRDVVIRVATSSGPADSLRIWSTYRKYPGFLANLAPSRKV